MCNYFELRKEAQKEKDKEKCPDSHVIERKTPRWKHFTDREVEGLEADLIYKLDRARDLCGFPFIITSGRRTPEQNEAAGGIPTSSHLTGLGVDIKAPRIDDPENSILREKMTWAFGVAGLRRVGSYARHFHVDVDKTKPLPCFFEGDYRGKNDSDG